MHELENTSDRKRFENIIALWLELKLNDPWSIGCVSSLVESRSFSGKAAWEEFYFESGKRRNLEIKQQMPNLCNQLNDGLLLLNNRKEVRQMSRESIRFNYCYGRTQEQLTEKAVTLFQEAVNRNLDITLQECIQFVRFNTIDQTWEEAEIREIKTIRTLREAFPLCTFVSVNGENKQRYNIDYEIYKGGILTSAIRIKPDSCHAESLIFIDTPYWGKRINTLYSEKFGKPVFSVIAKSNGEIINTEVFSKLLLWADANDKAVFSQD